MMRSAWALVTAAMAAESVCAVKTGSARLSRRHLVERSAFTGLTFSAAWLPSPAAALKVYADGNDERCENGEGAACERIAGDNELVRRLQAQSRLNRAKNERELFDKTVRNLQYSDYFEALEKNLVQLPNSSYVTLDGDTYKLLRKEGRIQPGAVDRLLPEGKTAKAAFIEAANDPEFVCSRGFTCRKATDGSLDYNAFKRSLYAKQVEGVVFQPPHGDAALVLVLGLDQPLKVDMKGWKRSEMANILKRLDVPNNLAQFE